MNAQSLLTQLSYSEFSNLALSGEGSGTIRKSDLGKVITFINDGLSALDTLFKMSEKVVHVQLSENITNYHLISRFAESQQPQPDVDFPYILDMNREPFKGDVRKIFAVWDNMGRERKIGDESDLRSVFIMGTNMITVPYPEDGVILFIHYLPRSNPVTVDNLEQELDIPDFLVPALRAFVAHKVFMSMGTSDSIRLSNEYQNQYIFLINELRAMDAFSDSRFTQNDFENRGWV